MERKTKFKDQCHNKSNRQCCGKVDPEFRQMESDMHNLWPAIGELNADRSNFEYDIIPEEVRNYGKCDFEVMRYDSRFNGLNINSAEPPPAARGIIARTYKYMMKTYNIMTLCRTETLMDVWDHDFPPTSEECLRNQKILEVQGNDNPFITVGCLKG
jgi:deoxyribonuclease-1